MERKYKSVREELTAITLEARTPKAIVEALYEELKYIASLGEDSVQVSLPEAVEYKVLANLTREEFALKVEPIDERKRLYEISWM